MTSQYDITTTEQQTPLDVESTTSFLRLAGLLCAVGALIAVVGATTTAVIHTSVSPDDLSYPFRPSTFRLTEVLWTITHVLTLMGAIGLARSGLAGSSRLGRTGVALTVTAMALLIPSELSFAFAAHAGEDSSISNALGTVIGVVATLAGVGFTLAGIAVLRERRWSGPGRWSPLLCGLFVIVVLVPVQAIHPAIFLWPIAGWNACLGLLGLALYAFGSASSFRALRGVGGEESPAAG
jgi:hypothetical protein